jgi:hypothetical protein
MTLSDLLRRTRLSAALHFIGDPRVSALRVARGTPSSCAAYPDRGVPLKGGNQTLPDTFAGASASACASVSRHRHRRGDTGVARPLSEAGRRDVGADWLVSAMSLIKLRGVPVTPAWPGRGSTW